MFGEVISAIGFSFGPEDLELALAHSVSDPVKTHVDGLGALLFDGVSDDAASSVVVSGNGCRWLGMSHFFEGDSQRTGFFPVVEQRA